MENLILSTINVNDLKSEISETIKQEFQKFEFNQKPEKTEFLTRKETAKLLGVSLPTLSDWNKRGIIQAYRIASRIRYKKEEVINSLSKTDHAKYKRVLS